MSDRGEAPNLRTVRTCSNCESSEGYPDALDCNKYYKADHDKVCDEHVWDKWHKDRKQREI